MKEPSPSPFHFFFFCSSSNFRAVTRLETLATQATKYKNQLMNEILLNTINGHYDDGSCSKDNIPGGWTPI